MKRVILRTVVTVVALDAVSYGVLYWLLLPSFAQVIAAMPDATVLGLNHALNAVRLGFVGVLAARWFRGRRGLKHRSDVVPSVLAGAVAAMVLQLALGVAARAATGWSQAALWPTIATAVEWVVFPLLGVLFVQPGPPDDVRLGGRAWKRP